MWNILMKTIPNLIMIYYQLDKNIAIWAAATWNLPTLHRIEPNMIFTIILTHGSHSIIWID